MGVSQRTSNWCIHPAQFTPTPPLTSPPRQQLAVFGQATRHLPANPLLWHATTQRGDHRCLAPHRPIKRRPGENNQSGGWSGWRSGRWRNHHQRRRVNSGERRLLANSWSQTLSTKGGRHAFKVSACFRDVLNHRMTFLGPLGLQRRLEWSSYPTAFSLNRRVSE